MATFALVCEGLTDQVVLEHMIEKMCDGVFEDGVDINPLQPRRDKTDSKTAPPGGWECVLEYCKEGAREAFVANDFLVIQIDTDMGDHPNFGVPLTNPVGPRPYTEMVDDTVALIQRCLGADCARDYAGRIVFAVSVHSTESWLLLCLYDRDEPIGSAKRLNHALVKKGVGRLKKEPRFYASLMKSVKRAQLVRLAGQPNSLGVFLTSLESLKPTAPSFIP